MILNFKNQNMPYIVSKSGEEKMKAGVVKNGHTVLLTGSLSTQMHLRSVCFHSEAAETLMNVFFYYDSISRASVIFPLHSSWPRLCPQSHLSLPTEGLSNRGIHLGDLLVCWRGKTQ